MPASGSSIFTDADGYQASLRDLLELLVLRPREFLARLSWVELRDLYLLRSQEDAPRIAYVTLPPHVVFVTFPTERSTLLTCCGAELRFGDVMFHPPGEHFHQRTNAASCWGAISLSPTSLMSFSRTMLDQGVTPPPTARILRPSRVALRRLLRMHALVGRLAERNPNRVVHPEVARALEQDLIAALMDCLASKAVPDERAVRPRQAAMMVRFEATLAAQPHSLLSVHDLCDAIGVSERTLRMCCKEVLGMNSSRYQRLRRLKLVRGELLRPAVVDGVDLIKRYGYPSLSRFVVEYWDTFGEMPPIPARATADDGV
jgi:AraC-like DNA-binding protein